MGSAQEKSCSHSREFDLVFQTLRFKWPFFFGTRILAAWRLLVLNNSNTSFSMVPHTVNNANSVSGSWWGQVADWNPETDQTLVSKWIAICSQSPPWWGTQTRMWEQLLLQKDFSLFLSPCSASSNTFWMSSLQLMCHAKKVSSHRNSLVKQMYRINGYRKSKHNPALQVLYLKLPFSSAIVCLYLYVSFLFNNFWIHTTISTNFGRGIEIFCTSLSHKVCERLSEERVSLKVWYRRSLLSEVSQSLLDIKEPKQRLSQLPSPVLPGLHLTELCSTPKEQACRYLQLPSASYQEQTSQKTNRKQAQTFQLEKNQSKKLSGIIFWSV